MSKNHPENFKNLEKSNHGSNKVNTEYKAFINSQIEPAHPSSNKSHGRIKKHK